ncbi:NAD(P)-dependent alcohol dehydrogenase [Pyruvatibacter sp.]|uniref:zinc-dependent alcohol dehydrogenase family protein n=1 Tax=Pyruvatibacter sp. TaxID=1981328 RepID=UPI003265E7E0
MRAIEIQGAFGLDNLALVERDVPKAGPGQIVVRLKAACLNFRDFATVLGLGGQYPLPLVPLSDSVGTVSDVGEGVTRVAAGDRVCPTFFPTWHAGGPTIEGLSKALGGSLDGCAQDYLLIGEDGVVKVPEYMTDMEAAMLPCAALTAWRALMVESNLKAGDTVLVQGTGGVSMFALQFAKAAGARVIATSSSDEKLERAKALGADDVINYKSTPDWGIAARGFTGGVGVDHVVEVGGAETFTQSLSAIRVGGHVAVIGLLSGMMKDMNVATMFSQNARIHGITVGNRTQFEDMLKAMALHEIHPVIDTTFALEDLKAGLEHMGSGAHFGKIGIEIAS